MQVSRTPEQLAALVEESFAGALRPARLAANPGSDAEDLEREVTAREWPNIERVELMRHRAALVQLAGEAFRFLLPAYLRAGLEDVDLREAALYALSPYLASRGPDPAMEAQLRERIAALDEAQLETVRAWLAWARTQYVSVKGFPALARAGFWME
jgi:hypothetical protein